MRIWSIRRSFDADHSSSTYEFFALDNLTQEQEHAVRALTGEPARRHLEFQYKGDWSDIPTDWPQKLLTMGYDILVSESYDWWSVHLSLPYNPTLFVRLGAYECEYDSCGFHAQEIDGRMILYFGMQLDYGAAYGIFGEDMFEGLARLFTTARDELLAGDLSVVWAVFEMYCGGAEDEDIEPVEPLSPSGETLAQIMIGH